MRCIGHEVKVAALLWSSLRAQTLVSPGYFQVVSQGVASEMPTTRRRRVAASNAALLMQAKKMGRNRFRFSTHFLPTLRGGWLVY